MPRYSGRNTSLLVAFWFCLRIGWHIDAAESRPPATNWLAGVARVDITPTFPVRLSGYAVRNTESAEVQQRIFGKAVAFGSNRSNATLLVTVDNCGLSTELVEELCTRLARRASMPRDRIAVCSTHTHSAPCLTGVIPYLFVQDIAPDEQQRIDRYTRELIDRLETVSLQALDSLQPAALDWIGSTASFAANRRTPGGPIDHSLPILRVRSLDGATRAIVANYACHCTTLQGNLNAVCGDWAGFATEFIERDLPGAVALVTIGCGADSNPNPRGTLELARRHGEEIAGKVRALNGRTWNSLEGPMTCRLERLELPFAPLPTRDEWQKRTGEAGIVGYHARKQIQRLDRGESLPTTLPYSVQVWRFGNALALVFLPGEVVVDYALRLKKEFDGARLWVSGYANGVPCYIPSRRILAEGGYEAETSLWYYDRPGRLSPEIEDQIIASASRLLPAEFRP